MKRASFIAITISAVATIAALSAEPASKTGGNHPASPLAHASDELSSELVYGPLQDGGSRSVTARKDAIGQEILWKALRGGVALSSMG
jgi:hypothetical protein